jgi:transcriptional regulator with XRE-family HTH domain
MSRNVADDATAGIAGRIRAEMARQDRRHRELGELLGVAQPSATRRLRGTTPFRADELVRVARWLDVPVSELIQDAA